MLENQCEVKDDIHMIILICAVDQQASLVFSMTDSTNLLLETTE